MKLSLFPLKPFSFGIVLSLIFSFPALADQCAYVTKRQALFAIASLNIGQPVYFLCEPCGETQPRMATISALTAETVNYENFWHVKVNDREIDLAYTYINPGRKKSAVNLAAVAGCPATDVSRTLVLKSQ